jgi:Zn-dependent protease with chaperone function
VTTRTAARAALVCALAGCWTLAAWFLWRSRVPGSLHLPHLRERDYFTVAQLHASASFSRVQLVLWLATTLVQLAVLAFYAWKGARFVRESAAGPIGTGMLLGMLGFALVWAAELPFSVVELWWQRHHHLSRIGYAEFLFGGWFALGAEFLFLCLALLIVMGFARLVGDRWWLPAAPLFVGLALLFAFVFPYTVPTHKLRDPQLVAAARRLAAREGAPRTPIVVEKVRNTTSLPNAEATGIGPSRRIIVWDTIVDGRFSEREVEFVLAHELGHVVRDHIWKSLGWYALFAFPGAFLVARVARRRGGMAVPEAVPLSLLALIVLSLLALPLENVITRHMESEADWLALQATRDPDAGKALFRRFVPTTLSEPNPSTFEYVFEENHPTIMQRLAMVEAWRRYATSAAQSP